SVTLTCATANSTIFYTIDGSDPDPRNANGSGASPITITLTGTATVKAMATAPSLNASNTASSAYTRTDTPLALHSVQAAKINTEVIVRFAKPLSEATVIPGNFTINNGVTVSAAAALTRPGALAGYWKLDDVTTTDSSGNNNPGTVTAATLDAANVPFATFINPASANGASL